MPGPRRPLQTRRPRADRTFNMRLETDLRRNLEVRARGQHRTTAEQARRYLEIAMIAEDNPDLAFSFIEGLLEARAEYEAGLRVPLDWEVE